MKMESDSFVFATEAFIAFPLSITVAIILNGNAITWGVN